MAYDVTPISSSESYYLQLAMADGPIITKYSIKVDMNEEQTKIILTAPLGLVMPRGDAANARCELDEMQSNDLSILNNHDCACLWKLMCYAGMTKCDYAVADMSTFKLPPRSAICTPATEAEIVGNRRVPPIRAVALMDSDPERFYKQGALTRAMKRQRE